MAYSNWGAKVYKNGERRHDKEDVGVFDTDEANIPSGMRIFVNIFKNQERKNDEWYNHSHHAVLGDGLIRLCGYKSNPELYIMSKSGKVKRIKLPEPDYENNEYEISRRGKIKSEEAIYEWSFSQYNGNMIDLELIEPDGTVWKGACGYQFGAGFGE